MASSLETTNYKLPIFGENDTTDWDAYNDSMQKIDTEMAANKTAGDANLDSIKDMQESLNNTTALVNVYESRIESLESTATANTNAIAGINRTDQSQNARLDAIESELNDIPSVSTVITELQTEVAEIKVKNNSQDTEIGKNSTAITANTNAINGLKTTTAGLRTDLNSLDDRVESLETGGTPPITIDKMLHFTSFSPKKSGNLYLLDVEGYGTSLEYSPGGNIYSGNLNYIIATYQNMEEGLVLSMDTIFEFTLSPNDNFTTLPNNYVTIHGAGIPDYITNNQLSISITPVNDITVHIEITGSGFAYTVPKGGIIKILINI